MVSCKLSMFKYVYKESTVQKYVQSVFMAYINVLFSIFLRLNFKVDCDCVLSSTRIRLDRCSTLTMHTNFCVGGFSEYYDENYGE